MVTKSKNNKTSSIICILIVTILSLGVILSYPKIQTLSNNYKKNIYEDKHLLNDISKISYYLYYDILSNEDKNIKPSDIIIDIKQGEYSQEDLKNEKNNFNNNIIDNKHLLEDSYLGLDYYVSNKENNIFKKRSSKDLTLILNNKYTEVMKNYYDFYVVMDFDNFGNLTIEKIHGASKSNVIGEIYSHKEVYYSDLLELKPIKNMKYIYAIPKELPYEYPIYNIHYYENYNAYNNASQEVLVPFIIVLCLVAFFIPYKFQNESNLFKKFSKIPFEILLVLVGFSLVFIISSGEIIIRQTLENNLTEHKTLDYIINFIYWFINSCVLYLGIVLVKQIFSVGILNYIKSNSLIVKSFKYLYNKSKLVYNYLINFDLKDTNNKKILLFVCINFVLVSSMCIIWWLGVVVCIPYTIALFIRLTKDYKKIQNDYIKLLNITKEMSNGNLNVSLDKDLGVFNSIKSNLLDIKSGFKKAVDKEVKSEKMKTELISNVSHDLKTPLTSIITYTDLLKDENLGKEKQQEYIEILDKKSQRLKVLIEDLFEVSRANSGNINLNLVDVDVVSLIKQTIFELDDKIKEKSLIIKTNMPNNKVILKLDSQRTFRVFENLIINITKYALENSRVYIDVFNNFDSVSISFKNISKDEINFTVDEIEERFVRGDKSRTTEGSGLGLSIAKSFVTLQNGTFEIVLDGDLFKVLINFNK